MAAPTKSLGGRDAGVPNNGKGRVKDQMVRGTASVPQREETTADDCFNKLRLQILNAKFVKMYSNGTSGAPSHSFPTMPSLFRKHAAPSQRYVGSCLKGIPFKFESKGSNKSTNSA